jgi:superfamily II DNA/RNA helicase
MTDSRLLKAIERTLHQLEEDKEIVLCSSTPRIAVRRLSDAVLDLVPSTNLSSEELMAVRSLILHAVADKRFFDWEMPTLSGLTAEEFAAVAEKLPRG